MDIASSRLERAGLEEASQDGDSIHLTALFMWQF